MLAALAARFGDRFTRAESTRRQHGHNFTWYENEPPDAVVFATSTQDVQEVVRQCASHRVPLIAFGTGTSLEGSSQRAVRRYLDRSLPHGRDPRGPC